MERAKTSIIKVTGYIASRCECSCIQAVHKEPAYNAAGAEKALSTHQRTWNLGGPTCPEQASPPGDKDV